MSDNLRIVFAGTPEFAARHLEALIADDLKPIAVYTQPDRPAGRGRKVQESAVKQVATLAGITTHQPVSLKPAEEQQTLSALAPDLLIVVAYGLILPQAVLDIPRLGCINVHASLLPRWRGAAPIQRAIEAGDKITGVTIMQMDAGLDTGDMLLKAECNIESDETAQSLHDKLGILGSSILPQAIRQLVAGELVAAKQDDTTATYAPKLSKLEGRIDWHDDAQSIDHKMRALTPWPGSQSQLDQALVKCRTSHVAKTITSTATPGTILAADPEGLLVQTGQGQIRITHLQFPGKRMLAVSDLLNAYASKLAVGKQFS